MQCVKKSAAWHWWEGMRASRTRFAPQSRIGDMQCVKKSAAWRVVAAIRLRGAYFVPRSRSSDISAKKSALWRNFCATQPIRRHAAPRSRFADTSDVANPAAWRKSGSIGAIRLHAVPRSRFLDISTVANPAAWRKPGRLPICTAEARWRLFNCRDIAASKQGRVWRSFRKRPRDCQKTRINEIPANEADPSGHPAQPASTEGRPFFLGTLWIPDDLESVELG